MDPATSKPIRVLLIDDDEEDYFITRRVFARISDARYTLEWCDNYKLAQEKIAAKEHDIYLIDYRLGEHSGLELLKVAQPEKRVEPFILLTGVGDQNLERRSMKLFASDYLVKGSFGPELLSRTLQYAIGRKQAEQQRIEHLIELNRSKDEFISIASHQLRTPATGVKQYIGMLLEGFIGDIPEQQRAVLDKAYQSNERQLRIVADLLKVAQVDAGQVKLRKTAVGINEMVNDIIKEQRATFDHREQNVVFTPSDTQPYAEIDHDTIRMVIENIIDNASKYSLAGTAVTVDVDDLGSDILVSIEDEGVGIDPKDQGKLFEKFSRIDNPLSTIVGGTGLGLYWAKKIIDLHGGSIDYTSIAGKGTKFSIRFPKTSP